MSTITNLKETISAFKDKMEEHRKKMRAEGEIVLKTSMKEIFEQFPEISLLVWEQYTPYFNDGDECTFGVHEIRVNFKTESISELGLKVVSDHDPEGYDYDDTFDTWDMYKGYGKDAVFVSERVKEIYNVLNELNAIFGSEGFRPTLKDMFGDHVRVIVTPNKITVEDCEHD